LYRQALVERPQSTQSNFRKGVELRPSTIKPRVLRFDGRWTAMSGPRDLPLERPQQTGCSRCWRRNELALSTPWSRN